MNQVQVEKFPVLVWCCFNGSMFVFRRCRMLCQVNYRSSGQSQDSAPSPESTLQTSWYVASRVRCHKLSVCSCLIRGKICKFFFFFVLAGVFSTLKAVPQKEGYLGLYKGNGAMMVRIFPYGAIQFMAFDNYKKVQSPSSPLPHQPMCCQW